jgi:uncharacterized phage protein gp47/JayE
MAEFKDLVTPVTIEEIKGKLLEICQGAGLQTTSWIEGDPSLVLITIIATAIHWFSRIVAQAIRGQFLDLAEDPGDDGKTKPASGWLSNKGENDYGTPREDATFAGGFVTITHGGSAPYTIRPETLTFQSTGLGSPLYRNTDDPTIYTLPLRVFVINPGESKTIPVRAEVVGTGSNAAAGEISVLQTVLLGITVTNTAPILGADRETAAAYRARCRLATAKTSPNGPRDIYRYTALSQKRADGVPVNISRVDVSRDSATGIVRAYYASPSGAATGDDVTLVNDTINASALPDCVTYYGDPAIEVAVAVTYTVEAESAQGLTEAAIKAAVEARLITFFETLPIGGVNNTLSVSRILAEIIKAHPAISAGAVSLPAGAVSLPFGHVAKLTTILGSVTFV